MMIYYYYLEHPEFIGLYYLPVDFFSDYMLELYREIFTATVFLISGLGIILLKKWGWYLINLLHLMKFLYYAYNLFLYRLNRVYVTEWSTFLTELVLSFLIVFLVNSKEVKAKFNIKLPSRIDFSF
ncbi:hypothetical protein [Chondrinema litorale]|uniref:hypothetical protein n=1 Tax=Chondrinema litorale TaxID=2994555 RepID=UPI002543C258|nr:hypothetical protein [Chondrinema litorale]UZR98675.1 hypothetical protein OQ292_32210 [Chondrinema litorale]